MADTIEDITDNLEQQLGQIDPGAVDGDVLDPDAGNVVGEGGDDDGSTRADPYRDMPKEDVVKQLQSQEKQYKEIRSLHDRQMNELREQQKQQFDVLKQIAEVRGVQSQDTTPAVDDSEFVEEWAEKIAPDDPDRGKATIQFMRGVMGDALSRMEVENKTLRATIEDRLTQSDPDYVRHKAVVDELVNDGMSMNKAISFAKRHGGGQPAAQPGTIQPPGRVATGTRVASAGAAGTPIQIDAGTAAVLRMAAESVGIPDSAKFVQRMARAVQQDRQKGRE